MSNEQCFYISDKELKNRTCSNFTFRVGYKGKILESVGFRHIHVSIGNGTKNPVRLKYLNKEDIGIFDGVIVFVEDLILMQSTGNTDILHQIIYEKDVIVDEENSENDSEIYEVVNYKNNFYLRNKFGNAKLFSGLENRKYKIIGNTYQNPELI